MQHMRFLFNELSNEPPRHQKRARADNEDGATENNDLRAATRPMLIGQEDQCSHEAALDELMAQGAKECVL